MRKIRASVLILISLFISYRLIRQVDHDLVFDTEINAALGIVGGVIFIRTAIGDRTEFLKTKTWKAFFPTIIGLSIFGSLEIILFKLKHRDEAASILCCVTRNNDFNGASIDFRADSTYKLTSWCLGANYYRGNYTMHDSIIMLDKKEIEKVIVSNKLLLRTDESIDAAGNREKSVYQVDDKDKIIAGAVDFILIK